MNIAFLLIVVGITCMALLFLGIRWFISPILLSKYHENVRGNITHSFYDPKTEKRSTFEIALGSDADGSSRIHLSVIVPAYNEEDRLSPMMDECLAFLENRLKKDKKLTYEIIIVDDASKDHTIDIAMEYVRKYTTDKIRVVQLEQNYGKGGAIRQGVLYLRGQWILMVDADGATRFDELNKLETELSQIEGAGVMVGSRAHLEEAAIAERHPIRTFLMHGFHLLVKTLCVRNVRDTQCGFKLFNRQAARILFPPLHIERWAFDVELLYLAEMLKIPVKEIPVRWQEIAGSKLDVFSATLTMLRELILIRFCYTVGIWKATDGEFRLKKQ